MDDFAFDAALSLDTEAPSADAPSAPAADKAGAEATKAPENQNPPAKPETTGTTAPSETPSPESAGENKGALAKELEPFKSLLDSKKWDPAKPEFGPTVLKSYQELEARASRTDTAAKQTAVRADQISAILEGDIDGINRVRQSRGLSPIAAQKPLADRKQEVESLIGNLNRVLQGQDQDGAAFSALNKSLSDLMDGIRLEELDGKRNPGKSREEVFEGRKQAVNAVLGSLFQESKDSQAYVDALTSYFDPGGLFYALGIDVLDAFKTPELARGFAKIGQAVHVLENLDKVVDDRAKAEVERRRGAENGGEAGSGPERQPTTEPDAVDLQTLFG